MDSKSPRDTQPLGVHKWRQRLSNRRWTIALAVVSTFLLALAVVGAWVVLNLRSTSEDAEQLEEPPVSLEELADEFPELQSVLQDPILDSVYKEFLVIYQDEGEQAAIELARTRGLLNANDELRLTLELDTTDTSSLEEELEASGIKVTAVSDNLMDIAIPLSVFELAFESETPGSLFSEISGLEHVIRVRLPIVNVVHAGTVETESLGRIGVIAWQTAGYSGHGIKIGILDMGFDRYKEFLGTDLPAQVTAQSFVAGLEIDETGIIHGTAVAEIIHDIAPGADLYIAAYETDVEQRRAVDWLLSQGVNIISHSAGSILGPMDGSGPLADMVDQVVEDGVLWVNSAGNSALGHYRATFTDDDGDGYHEFQPGDELMGFIPDGQVAMALNWDDWDVGDQDYDLYIMDRDGNEIARSANIQDSPGGEAAEFILYYFSDSGPYNVAFYARSTTRPGVFDFYIRDSEMEYFTPEYSITSPADSRMGLTVGATYWSDDVLEDYSSQGPTHDGRLKPDISAPAGVKSAAYEEEFFGTSASTPHVSGAAALVWEAFPDFGPREVADYLIEQAIDLGPSGPDNGYGYGRLWMGDVPGVEVEPTSPPAESPPVVTASGSAKETSEAPVSPTGTSTPQHNPIDTPVSSTDDSDALGLVLGLFACVLIPGILGLGGIGLLGGVWYLNRTRSTPSVESIAARAPARPQLEEKLQEDIQTGHCPRCGSPHRPQAQFCNNCGYSLRGDVQSAQAPKKFCTNCGSPLRPTSVYCSKCGKRV